MAIYYNISVASDFLEIKPSMKLKRDLSSSKAQISRMKDSVSIQGLGANVEKQLESLLCKAEEALSEAFNILDSKVENTSEENVKLSIWERKLLDLSLRNNLLNMRLGKSAITFESSDIGLLEDELDQGKEFILERKELKPIYRAMRSNLEETGANTLFLTLGTLQWRESNSGKQYKAPILLLPVEMVSMKKDRYAIHKRDEEVILNITLMEFLKQNYEITIDDIQPLPKDTHGIDVSLVLHKVREAIKSQQGWEVVEDSLLGIFSFTKFIMWHDIRTHRDELLANDFIRSLVDGHLVIEQQEETVDAKKMEYNARPDEFAIPVDADSSQLEAIAASDSGQSFVLYGPPGTGKSQTITNIIANAVFHKKRVLFVAEKKAALDVVQSRLTRIGLDPFCLELHSNKIDKKHFLKQMQNAIDATKTKEPGDYKKIADALFVQRQQVNAYIDALRLKRNKGYSLLDCINGFLTLKANPLSLPKDFVRDLKAEQIDELCDCILSMDAGEAILGMSPQEHPLRGFVPRPQREAKKAYYSTAFQGNTLENYIPQLSQILENVRKQVERSQTMSYLKKSPRQYLETDYRWKKFAALAEVNDSLLENLEELDEAINRWKEHLDMLPQWKQYTELFVTLQEKGLEAAVERYLSGIPATQVKDDFMAAVYNEMATAIINQDESLCQFNGLRYEQIIEKYRQLTQEFQQLTQQELQARLSARLQTALRDPNFGGELTLLRKRIANKGRGATIRGMIDQMPNLLPPLCPIMLMSPLSVVQYVDIAAPKFDLVIFDEASQMPTSEAVGAIARAKSSIIVGDPKQMPPTNFFSVTTADDEEADIDDLESILDDSIALSLPSRYLNWHYRSKHESLIAFSNVNYYDGRLITFPSVDDMVKHVTWQHVEGVYDYGKTCTNRAEAEAIVGDVISRLQTNPERSIGVVAFSKQQSDLIEDILNEALAVYPNLETMSRESEEPLFVKNLENVQGDERDVILFSVGYGPDENGHVSLNFGPLNKVGGERRLNVAVSRARYEMKVFSTLLPEQIDERRTQAEGVVGLKHFLKFAQQGNTALTRMDPNPSSHNLMVSQLSAALEAKGCKVKTNVGTSSFRLDIAIVDPVNADRYLLGIICDEISDSKLKTARDREIVRPAVLKMLGWNIAHVWMVDWFLHPDIIVKQILEKL